MRRTPWWTCHLFPCRSYLLKCLNVRVRVVVGMYVIQRRSPQTPPEISSQVEIRVSRDNSSGADDTQHVDWMKSNTTQKRNPIHCFSVLFHAPFILPFLWTFSSSLPLVLSSGLLFSFFFLVVFRSDTQVILCAVYFSLCTSQGCFLSLGVTVTSQSLCMPLCLSPPPLVKLLLSL